MDQQREKERGSAYLLVIVTNNNESSYKTFNKDEVALSSKFRADVVSISGYHLFTISLQAKAASRLFI